MPKVQIELTKVIELVLHALDHDDSEGAKDLLLALADNLPEAQLSWQKKQPFFLQDVECIMIAYRQLFNFYGMYKTDQERISAVCHSGSSLETAAAVAFCVLRDFVARKIDSDGFRAWIEKGINKSEATTPGIQSLVKSGILELYIAEGGATWIIRDSVHKNTIWEEKTA